MPERLLVRELRVARPRAEVFAFFADAANLERITPPELGFSILTPRPVAMAAGVVIDYRLRLWGVPFRWRTRIDAWDPPHAFVDSQVHGPYAQWIHTHRFEDAGDGTRVTDTVRYRLPFEPFGGVARPLVGRQLRRIFDHRAAAIARLLEAGGG